MTEIVAPSSDDPVVRGLAQAIGGPPGRYAAGRQHSFWTPVRVTLALALLILAAAWVQKAPCREHPWTNEYQYTHTCYTDVFALYFAEGLADGKVPYLGHPVEYPVLTGALMGVIGLPVHALGTSNPAALFFDLTALVLAASAVITVWAVAQMHRRRPWDAAMVALAPAMVVTAYVNWDLLAIALATTALLAWSRQRLEWAGILLGLAISAKFYPLLFLGPLFLLCLRAGRLRPFFVTATAAAGTWLVLNVPVLLAAPEAYQRFFVLNRTRDVDWGTFWYVLRHIRGGQSLDKAVGDSGPTILNLAVGVTLVAGCALIGWLALSAQRRPRLGQLLFLVIAVFLLTSKVWSQQYVLWLIPLAVLARPRWRSFLAWQACELVYFFAFYFELTGAATGTPVIPEWAFIVASMVRAFGLLALCAFVVMDVHWPGGDVVRARGEDDPISGVLDGAPDVITWQRLLGRSAVSLPP